MSLIHEKPDPFRALPHWCKLHSEAKLYCFNYCQEHVPESGQLLCVYIGLWTARDDEVTLRFLQITLVKILAPVQRKKVIFLRKMEIQRPVLFSFY